MEIFKEKNITKSIESFTKKNKLTEDEKNELLFVSLSFSKYYNNLAETIDENFDIDMAFDTFDSILNSSISNLSNGLKTNAKLFYKLIPDFDKLRVEQHAEKISKKESINLKEYVKKESLIPLSEKIAMLEKDNRRLRQENERIENSRYHTRSYSPC